LQTTNPETKNQENKGTQEADFAKDMVRWKKRIISAGLRGKGRATGRKSIYIMKKEQQGRQPEVEGIHRANGIYPGQTKEESHEKTCGVSR